MIIMYSYTYLDSGDIPYSTYAYIIDIYNFNIAGPFGIYRNKNLSQMSSYNMSSLYVSLEYYNPYDISMDYKLME